MDKERILRKVIITAAVTGAANTPSMSDFLPITPKQITDDAVRAYEAGAAVAHIHARDPETGKPNSNLNVFREIATNIKSRCDMVVCITTGGAGTIEERIAVVPEFKPELASMNCGSLSGTAVHVWERMKSKPFKYEWEDEHLKREYRIFQNTFEMMRNYTRIMRENNTKPELEIWDSGQIGNVKFMLDRSYINRPIHLQFVMGVLSGMSATPSTLVFVYQEARRVLGDFSWSVAAIGRDQLPMCAVTLAIGGHVRVGLEDSLYSGYGRLARSSAEQVERVVRMAKELSIEPASANEARQMIGLKGGDKVNF